MRKTFTLLLALSFCGSAFAQNLNKTVNIENEYDITMSDANKMSLPFSVADSLTRFNYKFDYSVFKTPYKGAYEFSPYVTRLSLKQSGRDCPGFWLSAGAGFQLRPELRAVWSPVAGPKLSVSVYQDLSGYVGKYRTVRTNLAEKVPLGTTVGVRYSGYDISELAGIESRFDVGAGRFKLAAEYHGMFTQDYEKTNGWNSVAFRGGFRMDSERRSVLDLDVNLDLRFGMDRVSHSYLDLNVNENALRLYGFVGPQISGKTILHVDYDMSYIAHGSNLFGTVAGGSLTPKFIFDFGALNLSAGVNLSMFSKFYVRPDVRADLNLFEGRFGIYARITGGGRMNSYYSLKSENHWFHPGWNDNLKESVESLKALLGIRGSIASHFFYDLSGGYSAMIQDALWGIEGAVGPLSSGTNTLAARLLFQDYRAFFANAALCWKSDRLDVDARLTYTNTNLLKQEIAGRVQPIDMPALKVSLDAEYNFMERVYAGILAEAATQRKTSFVDNEGKAVSLAAYVDLGIYARYRLNRSLSFWIKGQNLLNESIQRIPLHVENGIGGTVGITLNFQ